MDTSKKIQTSKVIDAPADAIFALLTDPEKHVELDGSGMLRGVEGTPSPLKAVGQTFVMNMHQDSLGDYRMVNAVTAIVEDARIGWSPSLDPSCELAEKLGEVNVSGHTFTFDLRAADGGGTEVTETYEWMSVKDPEFEKMLPIVSEKDMQATMDNIAAALR